METRYVLRRNIISTVCKRDESHLQNLMILRFWILLRKLVKSMVKLEKYTKNTKSFKDKHTLKAKSSRKNLPLIDVLSEALDDEDDTTPCTMCHL